mgnify:CR=1 FL=1
MCWWCDALAQTFQQFINQNGWGFWAVELKHSQEFIGFTGLHAQPERFDFSPCVEIGWRLDSKFWHQGYATEAARACLYFAFSVLDLDEVVAEEVRTKRARGLSRMVVSRCARCEISGWPFALAAAPAEVVKHGTLAGDWV